MMQPSIGVRTCSPSPHTCDSGKSNEFNIPRSVVELLTNKFLNRVRVEEVVAVVVPESIGEKVVETDLLLSDKPCVG